MVSRSIRDTASSTASVADTDSQSDKDTVPGMPPAPVLVTRVRPESSSAPMAGANGSGFSMKIARSLCAITLSFRDPCSSTNRLRCWHHRHPDGHCPKGDECLVNELSDRIATGRSDPCPLSRSAGPRWLAAFSTSAYVTRRHSPDPSRSHRKSRSDAAPHDPAT